MHIVPVKPNIIKAIVILCEEKKIEMDIITHIVKMAINLDFLVIPFPDLKSVIYLPKYLFSNNLSWNFLLPWKNIVAANKRNTVVGKPGTMMPIIPVIREMVPRMTYKVFINLQIFLIINKGLSMVKSKEKIKNPS